MLKHHTTPQGWRNVAAMLLAIGLAFGLAACGGGSVSSGVGTSADTLSFTNASYSANQNAGTVSVTVTRSGSTSDAASVAYATSDGSAVAGTDYTAASGTLNWAAGDGASKTIAVAISTAVPFSGSRTINVALSGPTGGATLAAPSSATVTINGSASTLQFSASSATVAQAAGTVSVTVTRSGSTSAAASVAYATSDGSAVAGTDYTAASGTLNWAAGDGTSKTIAVAISTATLFSGTRTFTIDLSNPDADSTIGSTAAITVSITGGAGTSGTFGIKVSGNQFINTQTGNAVQIVGTNISGLENGGYNYMWTQFRDAGAAFWSQVVNWGNTGLNTVRLPLNEASWLNYTCYDSGTGASGGLYKSLGSGKGYQPDPNNIYQAVVKQAVADATAAGLYVILDLHWGAPNDSSGQPLCPIGQPGYADADHSVTFWTQVANAFKDNPAVMFELFNEPFGTNNYGNWVIQNGNTYSPGPEAMMLNTGGSFTPFDAQNNPSGNAMYSVNMTWNVASMPSMLDAIRATGATNVVLASPIGWAGEIETWLGTYTASGNPDPLKQFGVAWHIYGYAKGTAPPLAVLAAGYPIVITETYGFNAAINGGQDASGYTWAASQGIGYLWWGWNDWGGGPLSDNLSTPPWLYGTGP